MISGIIRKYGLLSVLCLLSASCAGRGGRISDSDALEAELAALPDSARVLVIDRDVVLDRALLLPSHTLVIIDDCTVKQADGCFDNVFRGANVVLKDDDPSWIPDTISALEDIRIIGRGNARIMGPDRNRTLGTRFMTGDGFGGRVNMLNFCFVRNMEVSGLRFERTRGYAINFEYCEDVAVHDIAVYNMDMDRNRYGNGDGVDIRSGCRKFRVWNIVGESEDDLVAINTSCDYSALPDGYPLEFSHKMGMRLVSADPRVADIFNVKVENIVKDGGQFHAVILFLQHGHRIHDVRIFDVEIKGRPRRPTASGGAGWVAIYSYKPETVSPGDVCNVVVDGVQNHSDIPLPCFYSQFDCTNLSVSNYTSRDTVRILGVGNSWTRDAMRYLSAIAGSAGQPLVVGHAYLGGSTLEDQWHGIHDTSYVYTHTGQPQKVHATYQYWKYEGGVDPVKTPSAAYENGLAGIGVTLERAVSDEPWDWIVFQPEATLGGDWKRHLGQGAGGYSLEALISEVKGMMDPEAAAKVKTALMVPFAYPEGNTDYREKFLAVYNHGRTPRDQAGWDKLYRKQYQLIQKAAPRLCRRLKMDAMINVGAAIQAARLDADLSSCGYLLQRRQNNTHLAEGIPKYIASLCYAYTLLGIQPEDITFYTDDQDLAAKARTLVYETLK